MPVEQQRHTTSQSATKNWHRTLKCHTTSMPMKSSICQCNRSDLPSHTAAPYHNQPWHMSLRMDKCQCEDIPLWYLSLNQEWHTISFSISVLLHTFVGWGKAVLAEFSWPLTPKAPYKCNCVSWAVVQTGKWKIVKMCSYLGRCISRPQE